MAPLLCCDSEDSVQHGMEADLGQGPPGRTLFLRYRHGIG